MNRRDIIIESLLELLTPLKEKYDCIDEFGDISSMHGDTISWFEMFARSTYGIISLTAVQGRNEYVDIFNKKLFTILKDSRFKKLHDYDQKAVELIPLIMMLYVNKEYTWDTYSSEYKKEIIDYFEQINHIKINNNNWVFFRIIVCMFIEKLSNNDMSMIISDSWKIVDSCYTENGWYTDGKNGPKDYYIAFGYHFYSLLYSYFSDDIKRNEIIKVRAISFAKEYLLLFDNNGRMIAYGRSMIYRYASLSFWSVLLLNNLLKDYTQEILYIIDKSLSWWKKQNITNSEGILSLGYAYNNTLICEDYNSSGSPYWVLKFYLILLIDRNNIIWNLPSRCMTKSLPKINCIANNDITVVQNEIGNTAYFNSYQGSPNSQNSAKYMKFAYSSATGFNLNKDATVFDRLSDDNAVVFDIFGVKHMRERNTYYRTTNNALEYYWEIGSLLSVNSKIIPVEYGYISIHQILSNIVCKAHVTGFAIEASSQYSHICDNSALCDNGMLSSYMETPQGVGSARIVQNENNSNIYHKHTMMPDITYPIVKGKNVIICMTMLYESEYVKNNSIQKQLEMKGKDLYFDGKIIEKLTHEREPFIAIKERLIMAIKRIIKVMIK